MYDILEHKLAFP